MSDAPSMAELLGADTPTNWGKWGPDDELGALERAAGVAGAARPSRARSSTVAASASGLRPVWCSARISGEWYETFRMSRRYRFAAGFITR